jgi:hypothetical protein
MEDETVRLTEKGLYAAMEIHQKTLDGWTLEDIAQAHGLDVDSVKVLLAIFYEVVENNGIDLGVYVPDTVEELE